VTEASAGVRLRRTVGVGVVGCGRIGTHRARLAAQHPAVDYLHLVDVDGAALDRLGAQTRADRCGSDVRALIEDPRVSTVVVSTPEDAHFEACRLVLQAGKPLLVEKPLALEPAEAGELVRLARETGTEMRVAYSARYLQRYFVAWDQIRQGKIGEIVGGWTRVYSTRGIGLAILQRTPHATPVMDIVTYLVDLVGWYLGPEVVPVEATARGHGTIFRSHGFDVDDVTVGSVVYSNGVVFGFDVSYALPERFPTTGQSMRVEIVGSDGALMIDDDHRDQLMYTEAGYTNQYLDSQELNLVFLGSRSSGEWADGRMFGRIADETRAWLDHLTAGTPAHHTEPEAAYRNLLVTRALDEAARRRTTVPIEVDART
jgi:predicted dehydrogenase